MPPVTLSYQLTGPSGAAIDGNGLITWTPSVAQVPSTNVFTTVVTDLNPWAVNSQQLSATNSFTVIVQATHNWPALPSQSGLTISQYASLRVTNTAMAPTMLALLLEDPNTDRHDLSSVKRFGYGASSMPAEVLRRARAKWPHIGFSTGFGMTELSGNVMFMGRADHERAAEEGLEILRSVGRQMPLARVRVVDENEQDCPPGVSGEIVIKGDQVLTGYWRNPEATQTSFVDGWFHSGDVGRWDQDGYLYIVDR